MTGSEIIKAIKFLRPTAEFSFIKNDYSTIKWDILEGDAPTWIEIESAHQAIQVAEAKEKAEAEAKREALLDRLGITGDEARLLLG